MNDIVKKFILENQDLINDNEWEKVYKKATNDLTRDTGKFTEIMLAADIHPESYLTELPKYFLFESSIKKFEIPKNIKTISDAAFAQCSSLNSVVIGDSVVSIGNQAFHNTSLRSIVIPDNVTTIGEDAFSLCYSLTSVAVGENVSTIGDWAFKGCDSLTSIVIPDSVTSIGDKVFSNCNNITSVKIGSSTTTVGYGAFENCTSLTSIVIPTSVTSIGETAFCDCGDKLVIAYNGTKEDWKKIYNPESFRNTYFTINCTDGKIVKKKR